MVTSSTVQVPVVGTLCKLSLSNENISLTSNWTEELQISLSSEHYLGKPLAQMFFSKSSYHIKLIINLFNILHYTLFNLMDLLSWFLNLAKFVLVRFSHPVEHAKSKKTAEFRKHKQFFSNAQQVWGEFCFLPEFLTYGLVRLWLVACFVELSINKITIYGKLNIGVVNCCIGWANGSP